MELKKWYKDKDENQFIYKINEFGGPGFVDGKYGYAWSCSDPEIWTLIDNPSEEEKLVKLLKKEATKRFSNAKTIKSAYSGPIYDCYLEKAFVTNYGALDNNHRGYLFYEGEWAEIDSKEEKISKPEEVENIVWKCFFGKWDNKSNYLIREPKYNSNMRYICTDGEFWASGFSGFSNYSKEPATEFETKWYEVCEKAEEYIPLPELWKETKERYPIGTEFIVPHSQDIVCKVKSHDEHKDMFVYNGGLHINLLREEDSDSDSDCDSASVYFEGKWAEIVSKKEEEEHPLIIAAKKRYPVGTKYYPVHMGNGNVEKEAQFYVSKDQKFVLRGEDVYLENPDGETWDMKRNGLSYNQIIFHEGKWAKILTEDIKPSIKYYTRVWHSGTKTIGYKNEGGYFVPLEDYHKECGVRIGIQHGYCDNSKSYFQYPSLQFEIDYYKTHGNLQTMNIFKEDDYVVLLQTCNGESDIWGRGMSPGMTFKLKRDSNNYDFGFYAGKTFCKNGWNTTIPKNGSNNPFTSYLLLRKATEEEIKRYQETEEDLPKETIPALMTSFGGWKIGDKVLCIEGGGNDTNHHLWKKSYTLNDTLTIVGFTESTENPYICAVCEGGYVIYIEQYPKCFQKCPEVKETSEKMEHTLNIGDKVVLSEEGIKKWGNQSEGNVGVVKNVTSTKTYIVKWGENHTYVYDSKDLIPLSKDTTPFQPLPQNTSLKKTYKVGDRIDIHGITFEFCNTLYLGFRGDLLHTKKNANNFYRMLGLEKETFDAKGIMPTFRTEKELSEHINFLLSCKPLCSFENVDKLCISKKSFISSQTVTLLPEPTEFINVERTKYFPQVEELKY